MAKRRNAELLRKVVSGELSLPQAAEFSSHFVSLAGGMKGFAAMVFKEYNKSPEGSPNRQRILATVMDMIKWVNDRAGVSDELGLVDEGDLAAEFDRLAEQLDAPEEGDTTA